MLVLKPFLYRPEAFRPAAVACLLAGLVLTGFTSLVYADSAKAIKVHQQIIAQTPLYDNPELAEMVSRVGEKLGRNSSNPEVKYRFFVLDDPGINAFTPGYGYIYMNRGLLAYMNSEGQLAAVLAHEIAHNTQRHIARRKSAMIWDKIASIAGMLATGSTSIGNAISLSNQARINTYGREMELEADEHGAEFMYRSNYDPNEMLSMLAILKDDERFRDLKAIEDGGDATYHGVFSSHPRSDKRLQQVVLKAGSLPPGESFRGRSEMREALNGVVVGRNYNGNKVKGYERFTHKGLGITFLYPADWTQTTKGKNIILKDPAKTVQLKLVVEKTADKTLSSKKILVKKYPDDLTQVRAIKKEGSKDLGTTGRRPQQRVAAATVGRNTYHFQGIAKNNKLTDEQDHRFVEIIETFRRASSRDLPPSSIKTIYYERLEPGVTFADLAKGREMGTFTEEYLRLMNGYFPTGEAEPGTWMKLVKSGPPLDDKEIAKQSGQTSSP